MLTAHTIKVLQSLDKKKFRQKYNLFLVEGNKIIKELENSPYTIQEIYTTTPENFSQKNYPIIEINSQELKKISFLQSPKDSVAVCTLFSPQIKSIETLQLILDGIQDPGNLGAIIRLCDWFGVEQIICSEDTVDLYNPKVLQASKGSFARVSVVYQNIEEYIKNSNASNWGTDMCGENIYSAKFPSRLNLILGNEGNGMRPEIEALMESNITIPRFGKSKATESLNVAMATGIILGTIFSKK